MSIRHIARIAMVTVGMLGAGAALSGCGAEPVKEAAPPPISATDATKDRIKSIQDASSSKGAAPKADGAKPGEAAPGQSKPAEGGNGK
jgi:hypothetical protein